MRLFTLVAAVLFFVVRAATAAPAEKIEFTQETLDNGLHVIYAPLHTAPVVHVRVIYHVGSRDERPDRQGFAHMFEHMMFRGSAHVQPEEHMKLVGIVGGYSNAFTSFDQTVYHETLPSTALEMALYLEADRMASFKVSDNIFKTERNVVAEEWRLGHNRPYGSAYEDFLKAAFTTHSYRWTPIGNMDQLKSSRSNELQEFFNTYYLPNNATLVVAGDFQNDAAKQMVRKYFGWIPKGPDVKREVPQEPEQTAAREAKTYDRVPLTMMIVGYKVPPYRDPDNDSLELLSTILGGGRSSRLDRLLVNGKIPQAVQVEAMHMVLEDAGIFGVGGVVLLGHDPKQMEKALTDTVADVVAHGVTQEELDKAKTQARVGIVHGRQTAEQLASQLGDEYVFGGDANRVNTELSRIEAITLDDIQRVAKKYLLPEKATTLTVVPDPLGTHMRSAATQMAIKTAPVLPSTEPVKPRPVQFPPDYPVRAPTPQRPQEVHFEKGTEFAVNGVKVIVMPDHRLPIVTWNLTTRAGSDADPKGKEGLSGIADDMIRRGAGDLSFEQLNQDLESRGISIEVGSGGDLTRLSGSCLSEQVDHMMTRARQFLLSPTFPADEFKKLKDQSVSGLTLQQESPTAVAGEDLAAAIYGDSPLGRHSTPGSVQSITLDDVKRACTRNVIPRQAILVFAGDLTVDRGRELAKQLLDGWNSDTSPPDVQYPAPATPSKRRIILVDRPEGKQATIRMAIPAYDIHTDEKYAGSIAGQILSAGIESRLGKYVRAQKGLAYGVHGVFMPGRHGGTFSGSVDTAVEHTADAIEAMFKVFDDMRAADVTPQELAEAKERVAGGMVMGMQTIQQQAGYRIDAILNGYPIDYYDVYPARVAQVTADQVRQVMNKYVDDNRMTIVVVAPASEAKEQLKRLGDVEVVPMPAKREGATTQPSRDLLKPAA